MEQSVKRFGSVVELRPEKREHYRQLHANPWPEINAMIKQCNLRNYSIYETQLNGRWYLFSYFEYVGDDFEADMARMAADPNTQRWWSECVPCLIPLSGEGANGPWRTMAEVYHLD